MSHSPGDALVTPSILVACLSAHNNGAYYEEWFYAAQHPDDLQLEVLEFLESSPEPGAEEWLIRGTEGFEGIEVHAQEKLPWVCAVAEAIDEHGAPFAAWLKECVGEPPGYEPEELANAFKTAYRGAYNSCEDYVERVVDVTKLPADVLHYYFDTAAYAADLERGGDMSFIDADGNTYAFTNTGGGGPTPGL